MPLHASLPHPILDTLTEPAGRTSRDPHGMLDLVRNLPDQCREAIDITVPLGRGATPIGQALVTGMGGSAIGGDFAARLMSRSGRVPLLVNRDYSVPAFVGPETLVIAVSYSGDTEETLAAFGAARAAGASLAVITSGGALGRLAEDAGADTVIIPGGLPPRSALGYLLFPLLAYLSRRNLFKAGEAPDLQTAVDDLRAFSAALQPDVSADSNQAKQLAVTLEGKLPVIYAAEDRLAPVAYRWKSQINENAKTAAFCHGLPEQSHNEIAGWTRAATQASNWAVVMLRDSTETVREARRVEATLEGVRAAAIAADARAYGDSLLSRMLTLTMLGDFVSVYLAFLSGVCPTRIDAINAVKTSIGLDDPR